MLVNKNIWIRVISLYVSSKCLLSIYLMPSIVLSAGDEPTSMGDWSLHSCSQQIWKQTFTGWWSDCPFILFMGFSGQEYWSGLSFPSLVEHILSDLSTMTHLSWMALHGMAHIFTELDKALVHVIRLVSFLWLWFSVCLSCDGEG